MLFLASQLYNIGFNRIPPVTLTFIGINVAVYLQLLNNLPSLGKACVSAHHVWYNGDWKRIIFAAFYHLNDFHLYYNMASFVWKGMSLEPRMGSPKFLYILSVFTALTNTVLVALDMVLANVTEDFSYMYTCAAGFSGVIFALKVLTTYNLPSGVSMVMGMFPVPMRWACWAELIVIQLLVPNASFTGHLAGILVGMMYVKGPLKYIMDTISGAGSGVTRRMRQSYTYHVGTTGRRRNRQPPDDYDSADEELREAIRASLRETHMNRQPNLDDYDPRIQTAIRESLDNPGGEPSRWSDNQQPQRRGPSSGSPPYPPQNGGRYNSWSATSSGGVSSRPPPYSTQGPSAYPSQEVPPYPREGGGLYPRLPDPTPYTGGAFAQSPPYPSGIAESYSSDPEPSAPPQEHVVNGYTGRHAPYPPESVTPQESSLDEVRRRRLQRFER